MTPDTTPLPAWVEGEIKRLEAEADKCSWEELEARVVAAQATGDHEVLGELFCIGIIKASGGAAALAPMRRLVVSQRLQGRKWYA